MAYYTCARQLLRDMKIMLTYFVLIAVIFFVSGFGWGRWFAESSARKERSQLEQGRLLVSMPVDKEEADAVLETLRILIRNVREERSND